MNQPSHIPLIASGVLNATYTAPGKPWDGAPCVLALDPAEEADGFQPDAPFNANNANGIFHPLGALGRSLAPLYVDNWPTRISVTLAGAAANNTHGRALQSIPGTNRLLVRTAYGGGGASGPFYYSTNNPETDLAADWTLSAAPGLSTWVACGVKSVSLIATCETNATGNVRYTTDLGATWSNGGTIPLGLDGGVKEIHYAAHVDKFLIVGDAGYNVFSRDATAGALGAGGNWTSANASPSGTVEGMTPVCVESNSTETLIAWSGGYVTRSTNGTSWAVSAALTGWAGSVAGLAWSESHQRWALLTTGGRLYLSSDGAAWTFVDTLGAAPPAGSRLCAVGRYWIAQDSTVGTDRNKPLFRFDMTEGAYVHNTPRVGSTYGALEVHTHTDGRAVAYLPGQMLFSLRLQG